MIEVSEKHGKTTSLDTLYVLTVSMGLLHGAQKME
jgi:hypothetical protein